MSQLVDLSHRIKSGKATYPGLPAPRMGIFESHQANNPQYSRGTGFHISNLTMVTNCGTYVDSPYHRYADAEDVSALCLERLANLDAICVDADSSRIGADVFSGLRLSGRAVLIRTGWDRHWGCEDYFHGHPYLTREAAELLVTADVLHVGIDSLNIDDTSDPDRPVHSILLAAGIPITEHLTRLDRVPDRGFRYFAVPAPFVGAASFPVRAFACF